MRKCSCPIPPSKPNNACEIDTNCPIHGDLLEGENMTDCDCCGDNIDPERQAWICEEFNFCPHCGYPIGEELAEKEKFWMKFSAKVAAQAIPEAIEEYGDFEDDGNLEDMSASELLMMLGDLANRYRVCGAEPIEILHLAHFVALIYYKKCG